MFDVLLKVKRDPDWNEWRVEYYWAHQQPSGPPKLVYSEERTYYASDQEDAEGTAKAMFREVQQEGGRAMVTGSKPWLSREVEG